MDKQIDNIRKDIDQIDKDILSLLEKRVLLVKQVGNLKSTNQNISYIKADREYKMIESLSKATSSIPKEVIYPIWRNIISHSLYSEKKYKISFLGDEKSFNESYNLIRTYFGLLPEVRNYTQISDIKDNLHDTSNVIIAKISNEELIELLLNNQEFKIFAKLESKITDSYYAIAKIPKKYLADNNKIYLIKNTKDNNEKNIIAKTHLNDTDYLIISSSDLLNTEYKLLGSYSTITRF